MGCLKYTDWYISCENNKLSKFRNNSQVKGPNFLKLNKGRENPSLRIGICGGPQKLDNGISSELAQR